MNKKQMQTEDQLGADVDESHVSYFWEYLHSDKGHEVATRVLSIIEDVKNGTLERSERHSRFEGWLRVSVVMVVVIAASALTYAGKFDTPLGILFGTLVGYLFGRGRTKAG